MVEDPDEAIDPLMKLWFGDTMFSLIVFASQIQPHFSESRNALGTMCFIILILFSILTIISICCAANSVRDSQFKTLPLMIMPSMLRSCAFTAGLATVGLKTFEITGAFVAVLISGATTCAWVQAYNSTTVIVKQRFYPSAAA